MSDPSTSAPKEVPPAAADAQPEQLRLRLYSERDADGEVRAIYLIKEGEQLALWSDEKRAKEGELAPAFALPPRAIGAVFRRYAKPLEEGLELAELLVAEDVDDEPLSLSGSSGEAVRLRRFRFRPYGWVEPADYLLWEAPGEEPVAAPAPLITSALMALARAAAQ